MSKKAKITAEDADLILLLKSCGLFDVEWYLARNPDVAAAGVDPVMHWFYAAKTECRDPNFLFATRYYLESNPDVAESDFNPLVHYVLFGEGEGRKPSPHFDPNWYAEQDGAVLDRTRHSTWLAHYLAHGREVAFSPNRYFSNAYYVERYPDVRESHLRPYEHFLTSGVYEGRDPSPVFNTSFYRQRYQRGATEDVFTFHLAFGEEKGYVTSPDADCSVFSEMAKWTSPGPEFKPVSSLPDIPEGDTGLDVFAFYLPQFHPVEVNNLAWGEGFTEWRNVPRAVPRFQGHYQPRIPRDLGYYDLRTPDSIADQCRLAERAGLRGFGMYYYNFDGERVLDLPIDLFMDADTSLQFFLIWANENWTRTWDGFDREVIKKQEFAAEKIEAIAEDMARHLGHPRYYCLGGRPLLVIYRPGIIPDASDYLAALRKAVEARIGRDPLLFMVQGFGDTNPRDYGLDGALEFPPHKVGEGLGAINDRMKFYDPGYSGAVFDYDAYVERSLGQAPVDYPMIRTVFPSWDNEARRPGRGSVMTGSTPRKYKDWLSGVISLARGEKIAGRSVIAINAWNEWCEGAYLEPDVHYGASYLCATAEAISGRRSVSPMRVLLVGHDAYKHGAQLLLLNLARQMVNLGHEATVILLQGGPLVDTYKSVAHRVHVCTTQGELRRALAEERARRPDFAITNTVVTGHVVPEIRRMGIEVVSLVHELPALIRERRLEPNCRRIAEAASHVVFASQVVRDGFSSVVGADVPTAKVIPQGIYQPLRTIPREPGSREVPTIINLGFGDMRKGYDLFMACADECGRRNIPVRFLWVGNVEGGLREWVRPAHGNVEVVPFTDDVMGQLARADLLFLSSREDPFPSVALEALALGLPVVTYAGTGGIADFVGAHPECGSLVSTPGAADTVDVILREVAADSPDKVAARRELMHDSFRFAGYVAKLTELAVPARSTVSAIIPNYNYERYIRKRILSVAEQTFRPSEIVVLDDCSPDGSLAVIHEVAAELAPSVHVRSNSRNTGSPFFQWDKGVKTAVGKYTWIAEADDDCRTDFLEKMVGFAEEFGCDFCFSDSMQVDENDGLLAESYKYYFDTVSSELFESSFVMDGAVFLDRVIGQKNVILNVSSVLWRTDVLREAMERLSDELRTFKVAGDWRIYADVCARQGATVGYLAESLNVHRRHQSSATHAQKRTEQLDEIVRLHGTIGKLLGGGANSLARRQQSYIAELRKQFELDTGHS